MPDPDITAKDDIALIHGLRRDRTAIVEPVIGSCQHDIGRDHRILADDDTPPPRPGPEADIRPDPRAVPDIEILCIGKAGRRAHAHITPDCGLSQFGHVGVAVIVEHLEPMQPDARIECRQDQPQKARRARSVGLAGSFRGHGQ